jgi:hypothetical protein
MNSHNKAKFNQVKNTEVDKKQFSYLMESLPIKDKINLISQTFFKTKRGCLLLSCLYKGMSISSAYSYAFKKDMKEVVVLLELYGWEISSGNIK